MPKPKRETAEQYPVVKPKKSTRTAAGHAQPEVVGGHPWLIKLGRKPRR